MLKEPRIAHAYCTGSESIRLPSIAEQHGFMVQSFLVVVKSPSAWNSLLETVHLSVSTKKPVLRKFLSKQKSWQKSFFLLQVTSRDEPKALEKAIICSRKCKHHSNIIYNLLMMYACLLTITSFVFS